MIIDTHAHIWLPGDGHRVLIRERVAKLDVDFGFERLLPELKPAGVARVILVSAAQSFAETQRLLGVADRFSDQIAGVIGYLDMEGDDFEHRLNAACAHVALVGLRLPLVVFEDDNWIRRPQVGHALRALAARGLVAQVLAAPRHLSACVDVLVDCPDLKVVIDHAGNPGPQPFDDVVWRTGLAALGKHTTALCKVGEFSLPTGGLADDRRCDTIFGQVLDCFGDRRIVFGSNWPVSTLRQAYGNVLRKLLATASRNGLDPGALVGSMNANVQTIYDRPALTTKLR